MAPYLCVECLEGPPKTQGNNPKHVARNPYYQPSLHLVRNETLSQTGLRRQDYGTTHFLWTSSTAPVGPQMQKLPSKRDHKARVEVRGGGARRHDRTFPKRRKKKHQHETSYIQISTSWSLLYYLSGEQLPMGPVQTRLIPGT